MIDTFFQTLRLLISLWWLWLIIFGSVFLLLGVFSKSVLTASISLLVATIGTAYLVLLPIEYLQITPPPPKPSSVVYPEDGGMPQAKKIEWDLMPAFYEVTNELAIPLLKQWWYIWIPGFLLILLSNALFPAKGATK